MSFSPLVLGCSATQWRLKHSVIEKASNDDKYSDLHRISSYSSRKLESYCLYLYFKTTLFIQNNDWDMIWLRTWLQYNGPTAEDTQDWTPFECFHIPNIPSWITFLEVWILVVGCQVTRIPRGPMSLICVRLHLSFSSIFYVSIQRKSGKISCSDGFKMIIRCN